MVTTDEFKQELKETLNSDQSKAFDELINFANQKFGDPESPDAVVLKGYAGTGKTYLVNKVIQYINKRYTVRKIAATAPTNKAVKVLEQNKTKSTRATYITVHKLLGLKEDIDANGRQKFVASHEESLIKDFKYLIVDEVSMLNDELCVELLKHKEQIKIIFMGDPAQIPPVNKEDCLPFTVEQGGYNFLNLELNEIMRQKGDNPIIKASFTLRDNLDKGQPIANLMTQVTKKNHGIIWVNSQTQRHQIRDYVDEYFNSNEYEKNPDYIKIIAWRNKTVEYMNNVVRQSIFGKDAQRFEKGDHLVANGPVFARVYNQWGNNYKYNISYNTSDEFKIEEADVIELHFEEKYKDAPMIRWSGKFWRLEMENTYDCLYVIHESSVDSYKKILSQARSAALKSKKKSYWVNFFNIMKWSANVGYNYAITAHKSQGSTYNNVILLEEDLNFNRKVVERNRIKYTAYTRAKHRLFILR
jgi:exodeoxyribonuclease-5